MYHKKSMRIITLVGIFVGIFILLSASYQAEAAPPPPCEQTEAGCSTASVVTYSMSNASNNYNDGYVDFFSYAWGYHALRWKNFAFSVAYNPSFAWPPTGWVYSWNADDLNNQEADICVFPNGNPPGGWVSSSSFDYKELAVGAAMYMDRWQSPVYTNMYINGFFSPVVIKQVTFTIDNPFGGNNFAALCDWLGWSTDPVVDNVDSPCSFHEDAYYTINSMKINYWDPYFHSTDLTIYGESPSNYSMGDYLGDPDQATFAILHPEESQAEQGIQTVCSQE